MDFKIILIAGLMAQTAQADEPKLNPGFCGSLLTRASREVVAGSSSRSLTELLKTVNFDSLNGRELAILAKAVDFSERHEAPLVRDLVAFGVPMQDVFSFVKPYIDSDLSKMEIATAGISIPAPQGSLLLTHQGQVKVPTKIEYGAFQKLVDKYQLSSTLDFIRQMNASRVDEVHARDVMARAFAVEDPEFVERAIKIGLKSANFDKLITLASKANHNTTLVLLGKIGISRYILHRNHNWLSQGLSAFSLVTGDERKNVSELLYDLSDLLRSPMLLSEGEDYINHSILVLRATQDTVSSASFDSSDRLAHKYAPTNENRFKNRVQAIVNEVIRRKMNIGVVREIVSMVDDRKFQLALATQAKNYGEYVPDDERSKFFYHLSSLALYVQSLLMSGDEGLILRHMKNAIEEKRLNPDTRLQLVHGYLENLPINVVKLLERIRENPSLVGVSTVADIPSIVQFLDDRKPKETKYHSMFWHERSSIERPMKEGESYTAAQVTEKKAEANQMIREGRLFYAIAPLTAARDVVGLRRLFALIMQHGRSLDAVYAALAIEWIETGKSPFDDVDGSPEQIEVQTRLGIQ